MPRVALPAWLRRGLEAAAVASIVAVASLVGEQLTTGSSPYALPAGLPGVLLLAPAVLALGVMCAAYPVAMAATRSDAILGSIASFLVAADLTIILAGGRVLLERTRAELPGGLLVVVLAIAPAALGLVAGQVLTPLGFGRRAGALAAIVAAIGAAVILLAVGMVG